MAIKEEKLIMSAELRARLGGVSAMTTHRWQNDAELNFPEPIKIRERNARIVANKRLQIIMLIFFLNIPKTYNLLVLLLSQ